MLKRKITNYLEWFYHNNNKALLLTGARQTGKSYSIRDFGRTNFNSFVEINFLEMPGAVDAIKMAKNSKLHR